MRTRTSDIRSRRGERRSLSGVVVVALALLAVMGCRGNRSDSPPVHLNPNVQEPAYRILGEQPHVTLLPPLDYLPMVNLMKRAALVLTDSGGIQEEAPGVGVPTLVLRETTERPEGVQAGTLKLIGTDQDVIITETRRLLDDSAAHAAMAGAKNPYGDGHAAERIVDAILDF